jgi:surface polysaccharide O-acyltransferase-like enzyme
VSWTHRHDTDGVTRQTWVQRRLARVLGPTAVYVALVSAVVVVLGACGVAGSILEYAGWAVAMHLWFLAVYLVVVSLTPIAIAAQRRWGLLVPVVLALLVGVVDVARIASHVPYLNWVNYLLGWGTLYQLGIAWHGGSLAGRRPWLLAGVSSVALALLVWLKIYPVSMIGVPGQTIDNTTPPTVALLAFGCAQAGIAMAAAPALNRALRAMRVERALSVANDNIMALYLWHMIPVVIVAIVGYPAGLLPQPPEGSADWWLARLEWVVVLSVVTAVELVLLFWARRVFAAPLPLLGVPLTERWAEPLMLAGAAMAAYALSLVAAEGFAPDGRFPWMTVAIFAAGALLAAFRPAARSAPRAQGALRDRSG